jgi:hypothetical protein
VLTSFDGEVASAIFDEVAEEESENFVVVLRNPKVFTAGQVRISHVRRAKRNCESLPESTLKLLLNARFLSRDETTDHDLDREIDIVASDVLPQVHLGACFCHSDHRFEMTNGDGVRSG